MKKILLYIICTLWVMAGCTDESAVMQPEESLQAGKVTLDFAVNVPDIPQATRTFAEPAVTSLHLIVFDENGYLVEKVEAQPTASLDYSTTEEIGFTATLTANAAKRTIHFVANYANAMALPFGSESDVIGGIKHADGQDAYWQCKDLTGGISTETQLGCIPLVHNFAKVTVVNKATDDFQLTGFTVVNTVTEGYISPYNMNTGRFAKFIEMDGDNFIGEATATFECREYRDITFGETGYEGYVPGTAELNLNTEIPAEADWADLVDNDPTNDAFYMYERSFETSNHTFVIVKGKYHGSATESYYKIDLIYKDDNNMTQYYNILRNFNYQITLTDVSGAGKASPEEAYNMMGAHNNLTSSVETQQLTNISDGYSTLNVSYTSEYIISEEPVTLYYQYIPEAKTSPNDAENNEISANGTGSPVTVTWAEGGVIKSLTVASADEAAGNAYEGWRCITITPQAIDLDENKVQTITITAGSLSRTVTYIMRPPYEMSAKCTNPVREGIGEQVAVTTAIPTKLPEVLFPLKFYIVAENRSFYPNSSMNQLPLEIIPNSLITPGEDYYTFGFVYNLSYDEYLAIGGNSANATVSFPTHYLTNTEKSASVVHVYNKYFSMAETEFINGEACSLTYDGYYGSNKDINLKFIAPETGTYTINWENQSTTVEMEGGDIYAGVLKTSTWSEVITVTVAAPDGTSLYSLKTGNRNKLNMKAASTAASDASLTNATTFSIFTNENDAKNMRNALGTVTNNTLKSADGQTLQRDNLKETDLIWFAYENGNYVYYASATAKALDEGTATLVFDRYEIPVSITNISLTSEEYYGTGKTVTIGFNPSRAGQYLILVKEGNNAQQVYATYNANAAGNQSATFTTKHFSGKIEVTIVYDADKDGIADSGEYATDPYSDANRNILTLGRMTANRNAPNNNTNVTLYIDDQSKGTITWRNLNQQNGQRTITADDLTEDSEVYFSYTSGRTTYKSNTITIQQAMNGVQLTFTEQ